MAWWQRTRTQTNESGDTAPILREDPQTPPALLPPPRGTDLTTTQAMSLAAVYRSVSLLASGVCQLSIDTWRTDKPAKVPAWVRRPDVKTSRSAFLEQITVALALHGNAYWRIVRDAPDAPIQALVPLNPVEVVVDETTGDFGWNGKTFKPWQISHLSLLRIPGTPYGLGPIQAARADLRGALEARDFGASWLSEGGVPTGVLNSEQALTAEEAKAYKTQWHETQAERGVAILGQGLSYAPLLLSPKDAQFLQSQQFNTTQIARLFGVPAHLLLAAVEGSSMTYTNVADADLSFMRWTLTKYLREIEEAISDLLPPGTTARFNLDAVLRPNTSARYAAHQTALAAGFMTVDEVRAIEGLGPMPAVKNEGAPHE